MESSSGLWTMMWYLPGTSSGSEPIYFIEFCLHGATIPIPRMCRGEMLLVELTLHRPFDELRILSEGYRNMFGEDLAEDILTDDTISLRVRKRTLHLPLEHFLLY